DAAGGSIARVQQVRRAAVVAFLGCHGANDCDVAHDARGLGPMLGDGNARCGRGNGVRRSLSFRPRLGVKGFELSRAARHPGKYARLVLFAQLFGSRREKTGPTEPRNPGRADAGGPEKSAATDAPRRVNARFDPSFAFHGSIPY